jgi:ATP-dependent protease ClpP protease subunit
MNEILIYDIVGQDFFGAGVIAKDVKEQLDNIDGDVTVRINSPGGDVFEGLAIHNLLAEHEGKVTVKVDGYAASIASVIAMAGDEIEMAENAMFMIHNPYTFTVGDADEMRKQADVLDKVKDSLVTTYTARTVLPAEQLSALMDAETWWNAAESVENGFADSVSERKGKVSNVSAFRWINKAPDVEELHPNPKDADYLARSVELDRLRGDITRQRQLLK